MRRQAGRDFSPGRPSTRCRSGRAVTTAPCVALGLRNFSGRTHVGSSSCACDLPASWTLSSFKAGRSRKCVREARSRPRVGSAKIKSSQVRRTRPPACGLVVPCHSVYLELVLLIRNFPAWIVGLESLRINNCCCRLAMGFFAEEGLEKIGCSSNFLPNL